MMYRLYFPRLHVWSKSNYTFEQLSTAPKKDPQRWDFARERPNDVFAHCRKLPSSPGESKSEGYQWPFHLFFLVHQIYVQKCCGFTTEHGNLPFTHWFQESFKNLIPIPESFELDPAQQITLPNALHFAKRVLHHGLHSWPGDRER